MSIKGYKAFGKGLVCKGKQYAEGETYEEQGERICEEGMMHFCRRPADCLNYYPLVDDKGEFSEFAEVEALENVVDGDDGKSGTNKLKIVRKITFGEYVDAVADSLIKETQEGADLLRNCHETERSFGRMM